MPVRYTVLMVAMHFGFLLIPFIGLIVVAAFVFLVVMVARAATSPPMPPMPMAPPASARETPLEILARRFASGEITADEYQKARDLLQGGSRPASS
jgi:uncharacterized membrane protein